jgi:hypothetical protein
VTYATRPEGALSMGQTLASMATWIRREGIWIEHALEEGDALDDVCLMTAIAIVAASLLAVLILVADII